MKKIIRLTESDLARIVRRVIAEESQSTPNVSIDNLTFSVTDGNGLELYKSHKVENGEVKISLTQTMFDADEIVTVKIGGGFVGTTAKIDTETGLKGLTVIQPGGGSTMFETRFSPSMIVSPPNYKLTDEVIFLTGNIGGGSLRLRLNFSASTIAPKPTNESYRRRYRRY